MSLKKSEVSAGIAVGFSVPSIKVYNTNTMDVCQYFC